MEMLNIQIDDGDQEELVNVIQDMARLRGANCRISEQLVVKTDDHQLAEAVVVLLGKEQVHRLQLKEGLKEVPARQVPDAPDLAVSPAGSHEPACEGEMDSAAADNPRLDRAAKAPNIKKLRLCPRCYSIGVTTPLTKNKHYCPKHANSHYPKAMKNA